MSRQPVLSTRRVANTLKGLDLVTDVHEVMGPYDIVVELEAEQLTDVPAILSNEIRSIEGIQSTTSLVADYKLDRIQMMAPEIRMFG